MGRIEVLKQRWHDWRRGYTDADHLTLMVKLLNARAPGEIVGITVRESRALAMLTLHALERLLDDGHLVARGPNPSVADALESRDFYEVCQTYRHAVIGAEEFEALKDWIRKNAKVNAEVTEPQYAD